MNQCKVLQPGDLIVVVSPSFSPDAREFEAGIESFRRNGFRVETAPESGKSWGRFAGTDAERQADLQWALDHPEAAMIICSRGGYGLGRIVRNLDFTGFRKKPKWLVGFSDITLLHAQIQLQGWASVHGPMLVHHARLPELPACLKQQDFLVRKNSLQYAVENPFPDLQTEKISGILVGGNLSLLSYFASELPESFFENRLVFLEEVGEPFHKIDRMLDQMFRSGKLRNAVGFVLGSFSECPANEFPLDPVQMLKEKAESGQVIFTQLPCGHASPSFPLVLGYPAEIFPEHTGWKLRQPAPGATS